MCLLGESMKILSLLMTKISGPKEKCQSEKYEYKVIFPYKYTMFLLPHSKTLRKWLRNGHENRYENGHENGYGFLPKDLLLKMLRFFTTNHLQWEHCITP
jgi:hypothetical protein